MKQLMAILKTIGISLKDFQNNPAALIFVALILLLFLPDDVTPVNMLKIAIIFIVILFSLIIFAMRNDTARNYVKKLADESRETVKKIVNCKNK